MLAEAIAPPTASTAPASHPLDPLTPEEMTQAIALLRAAGRLGPRTRLVDLVLHEPPKHVVLNYQAGAPITREAFAILLDSDASATYEAIVSLGESRLASCVPVPGVQPPITIEESIACNEAVRNDPQVQAALRLRGITDFSLLQVEAWSAGNYGADEETRLRIVRPLLYMHAEPDDNGYARPVEGVLPVVDLNTMQVLRVDDYGLVPVPTEPGNYSAKYVQHFRTGLQPLEITQPQGPSFTVEGHMVRWQKWSFHVGFTTREGLVLHTVGYEDQGRVRPILYRASLAEMTVPYGDPSERQYRKNAFDVGEYGMGRLANALELGCDCLGEIRYFDAYLPADTGEVVLKKNAICLHEEDFGVLWKHTETDVRRSRRLVVSFISTVGNYDYAYYWYFYQDGSIEFEIKLTGIMSVAGLPPGDSCKYGVLLAPGLYAPNHQHFMNVRLDMMVDGLDNAIYEVHTEAEPRGPANPYGNAFFAQHTLLEREQQAQQLVDPLAGRHWRIVNHKSLNRLGQPVSYQLLPGENVRTFSHPDSSVGKRAVYMSKHLWVTPYQPDENFPAGDYPNQHAGGDGLPKWTAADRPIVDRDIVVWYTLGSNHIGRPEEWPIMAACRIGFMLRPAGFFDRNPALDVPPTEAAHCH